MRQHESLFLVVACAMALPVFAESIELTPQGLAPVTARWQQTGASATSPEHRLAPSVRIQDGAVVLEITMADGRPLRLRALDIHALAALPAGDVLIAPSTKDAESDGRSLIVSSSWFGVHELFTLKADAVKHDLVLGAAALNGLGPGDIVAEWTLELPVGARAMKEDGAAATAGVRIEDDAGRFLARLPAPAIRDADDAHATHGLAHLELGGREAAPTVKLIVPGTWAHSPDRALPLLLDPTVSLQPTSQPMTGFVDELGNIDLDQIASGTLTDVAYGAQVRGFAEFPLGSIPDASAILTAHLRVWLANHDNPFDPAVPLPLEVKFCPLPSSAPPLVLHAAIPPMGAGRIYATETVPRTGPEFCASSYEFRDYDLGPLALADIQAQLPADFFTVGFTSDVVTDPGFDHIDYVGYLEEVNNPFLCSFTDFPGTRITLVLEYVALNRPPVCNAGGPYSSPCPSLPIPVSAALSSDPDGDPLTFAWTSSCSGSIENASQVNAILHLDASCGEDCTVTVTVSDGIASVACSAPVSAHDIEPPVVSSSNLNGFCLWPPRHDLYCLGTPASHVSASDACQPGVQMRWIGCLSDQPDEAREAGRPENGDGNFSNDCQVSADGQELCVRVERAGSDPVDGHNTFDGRHYGVGVEVSDGCGNVVVVEGSVFVPHDRRGGSGGQDDPCQSGSKTK